MGSRGEAFCRWEIKVKRFSGRCGQKGLTPPCPLVCAGAVRLFTGHGLKVIRLATITAAHTNPYLRLLRCTKCTSLTLSGVCVCVCVPTGGRWELNSFVILILILVPRCWSHQIEFCWNTERWYGVTLRHFENLGGNKTCLLRSLDHVLATRVIVFGESGFFCVKRKQMLGVMKIMQSCIVDFKLQLGLRTFPVPAPCL